ncbi:MAG: hypothetical protein GX051_08565, partial [Clostridiales bacterium]|nr:hypothetical protein [Clostridiales bacterium]
MNRQKNIAAVLIIALILFFGRGCSDETPDITVTHTQQITTATGEASGYVVKTYNGKIAVF